jgi:hypothetical protein
MKTPNDSARKLADICVAMRQLIEMSYEYKDGVCPSNLLEVAFGDADRLAAELSEYFETLEVRQLADNHLALVGKNT